MYSCSGKGGTIVDRGDNTYGGKWVINPSGGLISKGHPIGATGRFYLIHRIEWKHDKLCFRSSTGRRAVKPATGQMRQTTGAKLQNGNAAQYW